MVMDTPQGPGTLQQQYIGSGEVFAVGGEVVFAGTYDRTGVVEIVGRSLPIAASDFDPGITVNITGSGCEEAWGDTDLSYEEGAREVGFSQTDWTGPWFAVEQGVEDDERPALVPGLNQIAADHEQLLVRPDEFDATAVAAVWDLIDRALPILNEIRNLGECPRRYFDPDQLEWWETMLSAIVRNSILVIVDSIDVDGFELLALVDAGLAADAFGPNLPQPDLTADVLAVLQQRADDIIQEMIVPDGEELPEGVPCDNGGRGCLAPDAWDQLSALVVAKKMGWSVQLVHGETITASEIIDEFAARNGLDVEGGVSDAIADNDGEGGDGG